MTTALIGIIFLAIAVIGVVVTVYLITRKKEEELND